MSPKTKPKAPTWLVDRVDGSRMEIVSELPKGLEWLDHNYPPSYKEYTLPSAFIDNCSAGLFSQQISDPVVDVEAP